MTRTLRCFDRVFKVPTDDTNEMSENVPEIIEILMRVPNHFYRILFRCHYCHLRERHTDSAF